MFDNSTQGKSIINNSVKIVLCIFLLLVLVQGVQAVAPIASFIGTPTSGTAPLTVTFTDLSSNAPMGWAWFFGDETYTQAWTQQTVSAGWSARTGQTSVVMSDGSIVLMGGMDSGSNYKNDVWRSTDTGVTWTQMAGSAAWSARVDHTSVVMPDGSIVLMGGLGSNGTLNDTWRSTDNGATWTQMAGSAAWSARWDLTSIVMPDGSIVLMGGRVDMADPHVFRDVKNDVWRSTDNGAMWTQVNTSAGWTARYTHSSVEIGEHTSELQSQR